MYMIPLLERNYLVGKLGEIISLTRGGLLLFVVCRISSIPVYLPTAYEGGGDMQALTQPLSKWGYIVVEWGGGVTPLIVYFDNSYAVGIHVSS